MLKTKIHQHVDKKKGFSLLEVLIVLVFISIMMTSIIYTQRNILNKTENYYNNQYLLDKAKEYIYKCQATNNIIDLDEDSQVDKIASLENIETYKYTAKKGDCKIEVEFSIYKK